jgi:hypothetical protein
LGKNASEEEEELNFLRQNAQELEDLRRNENNLLEAQVRSDSSQFLKSELDNAILEIRNEYERNNTKEHTHEQQVQEKEPN